MRLDDREGPSCEKDVEVSSSSLFVRIGGESGWRLREMTACVVLLWLNETRLSLPHFSVAVKSSKRSEAEIFLWRGISPEAWLSELNENEELRKVSSAKE